MAIMFEGKYKRARKLQQERNAQMGSSMDPADEVPLKDKMEKGDLAAMIISAFITIFPLVILVLVALAAIGYFFVMR